MIHNRVPVNDPEVAITGNRLSAHNGSPSGWGRECVDRRLGKRSRLFYSPFVALIWRQVMNREEIIARLRENEAALRIRGVAHAALFGSRARDDQGPESGPGRRFRLCRSKELHRYPV
jgi:hypothetical protein